MKNNQSIRVLISFSLSFIVAIVFMLGYILSAGLVASSIQEHGGFLAVWGPPFLISLVCSVLCCLPMWAIKDKILIPSAFAFLLLYCAIALVIAFSQTDASERAVALQFIGLYMLLPALVGNFVAWAAYWLRGRRG